MIQRLFSEGSGNSMVDRGELREFDHALNCDCDECWINDGNCICPDDDCKSRNVEMMTKDGYLCHKCKAVFSINRGNGEIRMATTDGRVYLIAKGMETEIDPLLEMPKFTQAVLDRIFTTKSVEDIKLEALAEMKGKTIWVSTCCGETGEHEPCVDSQSYRESQICPQCGNHCIYEIVEAD